MTINISEPLPYTLLSLSRYAKLMGINPVHFWGGTATNLATPIMPVKSSCDEVWFQYEWQDNDKVSRFEVAVAISDAEEEIANALGWWPAPVWQYEEAHAYPRVYRREYYGHGADIRGLAKPINTTYGKIIEPGQRAVTLIDTASTGGGELVYTDEDGDSFYETATITVATTLTDVNEIKLFHTSVGGHREWEIRNLRSVTADGVNAVIVLDSWLLIDPELYAVMTTDDSQRAIDLSTVNNFVTEVDVYRVYNDTTATSAKFYWGNANVGCASCAGAGCEACGQITQTGCARIRNAELGILSLLPASYDEENGWTTASTWEGAREPDRANVWYLAGDQSNRYTSGQFLDPLGMRIAMVIAQMATARLDRPLCGCTNIEAKYEYLSTDVTKSQRAYSHFVTEDGRYSSFGSRIGEILAYRYVFRNVPGRRSRVAVI